MTTNDVVQTLEFIALLVVGATAPSYRAVMWRTFLVWLASLFIAVWITGVIERDFGDRWLMLLESWVQNFGKYLGMLMCSSLGRCALAQAPADPRKHIGGVNAYWIGQVKPRSGLHLSAALPPAAPRFDTI
jgi:hypothetical protein